MKLLVLFNEFFLYLNAFHQNLFFLEQTCTFLHLLTQLNSLSYVCFIRRHGIFNFIAVFLFCRGFFILPWLFCFAVTFLFCHWFLVLPWLFYFGVAFLFCRSFFIFALTFFVLPLVFSFAVTLLFCRDYFILPWIFHFAVAALFCRGFLVLPRHLWATVELVYKNPLKKSLLKSQFQNPRNLDEKTDFFYTIHTKTTSSSEQK